MPLGRPGTIRGGGVHYNPAREAGESDAFPPPGPTEAGLTFSRDGGLPAQIGKPLRKGQQHVGREAGGSEVTSPSTIRA